MPLFVAERQQTTVCVALKLICIRQHDCLWIRRTYCFSIMVSNR